MFSFGLFFDSIRFFRYVWLKLDTLQVYLRYNLFIFSMDWKFQFLVLVVVFFHQKMDFYKILLRSNIHIKFSRTGKSFFFSFWLYLVFVNASKFSLYQFSSENVWLIDVAFPILSCFGTSHFFTLASYW